MSIQGHKERILLRRGFHIKESIQRRSLDEHVNLRRSIITEEGEQLSLFPKSLFGSTNPEENIIKLQQEKDKARTISESEFWEKLITLVSKYSEDEQVKLFTNLNVLYDFLRPIRKDNRVYFYTITDAILKHSDPLQSLKLIVDYINNPVEIDDNPLVIFLVTKVSPLLGDS